MLRFVNEQLLRLLGQKTYVPSNVAELLDQLGLTPQQQPELQRALKELEQAGQVARIKGNRFVLSLEADLIPGRIRMNRQGKGFLMPDDSSIGEIAVPESATGTALHEDRVLVRRDVSTRTARPGEQTQATGSVLRVLERNRTEVVGTLQRSKQFIYVIPDDPRIPHDIYVTEPRDVGRKAMVGDKVLVRLREWESRHTNPEGEVVEVLGAPDEEGVDMLSVLRQYNLPLSFPKKVLDEARAIGDQVRPDEIVGRQDCRRHAVITIDPDDAKDFDDAICLERQPGGDWRLWVHIADVSHYVKPGTALDEEARRRGNSTYLVDRVIPMLPEALSNELCSLKPNVDRLTKCVEFLISDEGRVLKTEFYPAVIHSQRRFTYREALAVLQSPPADPIAQMLHDTNDLAQRIRRHRFKDGSLELDFPEMKIRLDDAGKVLRIERVENDISHQLIEECMLLANEAVAARLLQLNRMAVHRVHEEPDAKRLNEFREEVLGYRVPCGNLSHRSEVQKLLERLNTLPIGPALKIGFLRSLKRARYAVEPLGHYGLAKKHYAHFTSPIRRYADLVVHRALFESGHGAKHSLRETADHISATERNSADAERDSKDVKMYSFLESQLKSQNPQRYTGLVTDLRNFGFFVDVTGLGMSGLVPFSELTDDFYVFEPARLHVIGRRTRRMIRLGDRVEVQVARVDRFKKQVDFTLARGQSVSSTRPAAGGSRPGGRETIRVASKGKFERSSDRSFSQGRSDRDKRHQRRQPAASSPPRPASGGVLFRSSHSGRPALPSATQGTPRRKPSRPNQPSQSGRSRDFSGNRPPKSGAPGAPRRPGQSSWKANPTSGKPREQRDSQAPRPERPSGAQRRPQPERPGAPPRRESSTSRGPRPERGRGSQSERRPQGPGPAKPNFGKSRRNPGR